MRISFTFDPRDMLLYLQRDFSFVSAAVACVTLEKASGFEPWGNAYFLKNGMDDVGFAVT